MVVFAVDKTQSPLLNLSHLTPEETYSINK